MTSHEKPGKRSTGRSKSFERRIANSNLARVQSRLNELRLLARLARQGHLTLPLFAQEVDRVQCDLYVALRRPR